jgi:hypothetical protein
LEADISTAGVNAVRGLKAGLDPRGIMNPGKIIPSDSTESKWGLSNETISEFDRNGRKPSSDADKPAKKESQVSYS